MRYHTNMKIQLPKYLYYSAESAKDTPWERRIDHKNVPSGTTLETELDDEGIWKDPLNNHWFNENTIAEDLMKHREGQSLAKKADIRGEKLPHPIPSEYKGVDWNHPEHPLSQESFRDGLSQALEKAGISHEKMPWLEGSMKDAWGNFWLTFLNTPLKALGGCIEGTRINKSIVKSYLVTSVNDPAYGAGEVFGKILAGFASGELWREYYDQFPPKMQKVLRDIFTPSPQPWKNGDTVASVWPPEPHSHPGIQWEELTA